MIETELLQWLIGAGSGGGGLAVGMVVQQILNRRNGSNIRVDIADVKARLAGIESRMNRFEIRIEAALTARNC